MTNPRITSLSKHPKDTPLVLSPHAGKLHKHLNKDQELTEMDVNVIVILAQSMDFNEVDYRNTLIKRFNHLPSEAYLLAKVAAAGQKK
jgi:hypothetical protein